MTHILLVEDDPLIAEPILRALEAAGNITTHASDGAEGLGMAIGCTPDLVILDIMLPKMTGWEVCEALRKHSSVPILMLTALGEETDRIHGLEIGADDYLTKPFSTKELLARINALLRRIQMDRGDHKEGKTLSCHRLSVDLDARKVHKDGIEISLRYKEFELLTLLMLKAGQVVSRAVIFDEVWGTEWLGDMRTLDVHIRWLREKLEDDPGTPRYIQTVRGVGYRFNPEGMDAK